LLWLVNEHQYRNGDDGIIKCPTKAVFAASNEIPSEIGLRAIYDRFLLRYQVKSLRSKDSLAKMLELDESDLPDSGLSHKEVELLRKTVRTIEIPEEIRDMVFTLRDQVARGAGVHISDRRLVKSFRIMQASALMQGRKVVKASDIAVLANVFWDSFEQVSKVRSIVLNASNAKISDLMSYEDLAEELWQKAIKTGDMDEIASRLAEMYAAVSKFKSGIGLQVAQRINDYILRVQSIKDRRNDFVVMELLDADNKVWYKLSSSCESFWSQKQLRLVKFRWSRKHGYWWKEGPKKNKAKLVTAFRAQFHTLIEKKLGVKASFSKMI
jgi:hypothetical protein